MHELSIVRALLQLVEEHRPVGSTIRSVRVRVGPLQAIVPDSMTLAWEAATTDHELAGSILKLEMLPWQLHCLECDRRWEAEDPLESCRCGSNRCVPAGGDELQLEYLELAATSAPGAAPAPDGADSQVVGEPP